MRFYPTAEEGRVMLLERMYVCPFIWHAIHPERLDRFRVTKIYRDCVSNTDKSAVLDILIRVFIP